MNKTSSLIFARTLSGHFSNKDQAQNSPNKFAHINIYFRPISWSILKGPGFYSEQSYDYSPWLPYRQGLHKLLWDKKYFIIENYEIKELERVAGAGFEPALLEEIKGKEIFQRPHW